ncbi:MAG: ABC transporter permease subunit [Xanthobacteraceae bacterium]
MIKAIEAPVCSLRHSISSWMPFSDLAPIILVWFGLGMQSKLVIAFLVALFPIVVDTAAGIRATPAGLLELARSLRASPPQIFLKIQFPAALPFIFTGAKVAVTLAVIGKFAARQPARLGGAGLAERARLPAVRGCRRRRTDGDALVADRAALNAQC